MSTIFPLPLLKKACLQRHAVSILSTHQASVTPEVLHGMPRSKKWLKKYLKSLKVWIIWWLRSKELKIGLQSLQNSFMKRFKDYTTKKWQNESLACSRLVMEVMISQGKRSNIPASSFSRHLSSITVECSNATKIPWFRSTSIAQFKTMVNSANLSRKKMHLRSVWKMQELLSNTEDWSASMVTELDTSVPFSTSRWQRSRSISAK